MSDFAAPYTVHGLLDRRAIDRPDSPFLFFEDKVWTFSELANASARLAGGLSALGVRHGDRVAIMMSNRPEFLIAWFALSRLGAVEVPINTAHRGTILQYILEQSECSLIIVEGLFEEQISYVCDVVPTLRKIVILEASGQLSCRKDLTDYDCVAAFEAVADADVGPGDAIAIMFTSGTTGPSKGAVIPQNYVLVQAGIIIDSCNYTEQDCLYNALPLFHGNAQFLSTIPALMSGAQLVLARRFSASKFWDDIRRFRCTEFNYIGGILPILWKAEPKSDDNINSLRLMMGAGAPKNIFEDFERRFNVRLVESYGMSEIGIPLVNTVGNRKIGSCGRPSEFYEVRLVDDGGNDVEAGFVGELLVRPKLQNSMMLEYYRMPSETVSVWRDLWFHTGDYLTRDEENNFFFVDRKKDSLRRRGENISSFELESCINRHPAVFESAAIAVPSDIGEDEVMVCIVLKKGESISAFDIIRYCYQEMALFMVPRYLRFIECLPKTSTERVKKFILREDGVTSETYDRDLDPAWMSLVGQGK